MTIALYTLKIPHLEGEDVFGSTKQKEKFIPKIKLGDFHKHDCVDFFCPRMSSFRKALHLMQFQTSGAIHKKPSQLSFIMVRRRWNDFVVTMFNVATLALNSRPRQRVARLRAKKKTRESYYMLPGMPKSVREWTLTPPKWTPMLGVGVPMDSRIFRVRLQRSKPITFKSSLYP